MHTRKGVSARKIVAVTMICAVSAALAVGLSPSNGSALLGGNGTGGTSGTGGSSGGGTARVHLAFYDATVNGANDSTGAGGTVGGPFGTATALLRTPSTVFISVRGLTPFTTYTVFFDDSAAIEHVIGALTTNARGRGSGSYTFFSTPYAGNGNFFLFPPKGSPAHEYQTPEVAF